MKTLVWFAKSSMLLGAMFALVACGGSSSDDGKTECCASNADCSGYETCVFVDSPQCGQCKCPSSFECCTSADCGAGKVCGLTNDKVGACACDHCGVLSAPCKIDEGCKTGLQCMSFITYDELRYSVCSKGCDTQTDCVGFGSATTFDPYCQGMNSGSDRCLTYCYQDSDCPSEIGDCSGNGADQPGLCQPKAAESSR